MVKIISIQRMGSRGVVQFVADGKADAIEFNANLTDAEVRGLLPADGPDIEQLRARAKELKVKGDIDKMKPATLEKKIAEAEAANAGPGEG
ncbi:MAG: hypothetical protein HP002_09610 [Lentisphaeria bacterium]|nr:hypothetical protein [Lentisphaeria bacterium]